MDSRFVAIASEAAITESLKLWPELSGRRIRPLLVTAFGTIFVETDSGKIIAADPVELICQEVAESIDELRYFLADSEWSEAMLLVDIALLAAEKGIPRREDQVFAIAPHPCFTGEISTDNLSAMDLHVWHHLCAQFRNSGGAA